MCTGDSEAAPAEKQIVVPRVDNEYFRPDVRLSFRFDEKFRDKALSVSEMSNSIVFMFDRRDGSSIGENLIAHPQGVAAALLVSRKDPISGLLGLDVDGEDGYLSGFKSEGQDLHGLVLKTNRQVEVEGFPEEKLLIENVARPSFYILCEPSGNDHPNFCTMRWQDFLPVPTGSNASLLAELTFREENLPHWREIKRAAGVILQARAEVIARQ